MPDENAEFRFCPICGSKEAIEYKERRHWVCASCGFDLFNNVAAAVGLIIRDSRGRILLETRAKEPRKGFLALPGGFVDPDESAEEAAIRECLEETGIAPESVRFVCTSPNTYEYKQIVYKTCDIFFEANLPSQIASADDIAPLLTAQESEVSSFILKEIRTESDVDTLPLAFGSARVALKAFLASPH